MVAPGVLVPQTVLALGDLTYFGVRGRLIPEMLVPVGRRPQGSVCPRNAGFGRALRRYLSLGTEDSHIREIRKCCFLAVAA